MINNPRKFAITWLLEPTKKSEESQYEYVFRLVTCPVDKQTIVTYDTSQPDKGYIYTHTIETASTIPIIQANLYKKTSQGRNFIGTIEYFKMLRFLVQNPITETYFYVYILSATASALQLSSFEKQTEYSYNPDPHGIGLPLVNTTIDEQPSKIFTAEFFQFAESLNYSLNSSGAISISGISYPSYEYSITMIREDSVIGDLNTTDVYTVTGKNISFSYEACKSTLKNLDDYQGYLNTRLDREVSVPYQSTFAKCSNGLTFDRFMAIAQETQYLSKNTTITFEHD